MRFLTFYFYGPQTIKNPHRNPLGKKTTNTSEKNVKVQVKYSLSTDLYCIIIVLREKKPASQALDAQ